MTETITNSTIYVVAAYLGAGALYGSYLFWLRAQERKYGRRSRDAAR